MAQTTNKWDFLAVVRENKMTEQKYITIPFALRAKFNKNNTYKVSLKEVDNNGKNNAN